MATQRTTHSSVRGAGPQRSRLATVATATALILGGGVALTAATSHAQTATVADASEVEVFVAIEPTRYLDTRIGLGADEGPLTPAETITLPFAGVDVDGQVPVPPEATSVALNTAIPSWADSKSFITIWPTGSEQPYTAVNNAQPGQVVPNFTLAKLGDSGSVNIFNERGNVDFVIDVVGYYTTLDNVDLSTAGGSFGSLITGDGAPDDSVGGDGDAYVDESTGQIYVKVDGEYVPTGTPTAVTDSAVGAHNDSGALGVDPAVDIDNVDAVDFNTVDAAVGTAITKSDIDTFVFEEAGVYEVSYTLSTDVGAASLTANLELDGTQVGGDQVLAALGGQLSDTVLVDADAGDTLELVVDGILSLSGNSSITLELIAITP